MTDTTHTEPLTSVSPDPAHPRGLSAGRRNAQCAGRADGGDGLGNGGVTPPLVDWEPVYHRVNADPKRPYSARNGFRGMSSALHHRGLLSDNALVLYDWLLESSNTTARAVQHSVEELAVALGWGTTKVKAARAELENIGLLTHHNRVYEHNDGTRRFGSNRYGFTWNPEILSIIGWKEDRTTKMCGTSDSVWNKTWRTKMRQELREQAIASGQAQAERGIAISVVDDIVALSHSHRDAADAIGLRYSSDAGMAEFALDYLDTAWKRHEAARYGRQIAELDLSFHSRELKIRERYGENPELLALALAPLELLARLQE